jgi:hypothetical protein
MLEPADFCSPFNALCPNSVPREIALGYPLGMITLVVTFYHILPILNYDAFIAS